MTGKMNLKQFLENADCSGGPNSCGIEYYNSDRVRVNKPNNRLLGCADIRVGSYCRVIKKTYLLGKPYSLIVEFKKSPVGIILHELNGSKTDV